MKARAKARICEDPYDRLFSVAVPDDAPQERMAESGDPGFMEFEVEEHGIGEVVFRVPALP